MSAPNLKVVKYPSVRDFLQWLRSKQQTDEAKFMVELQGRIVDVEVFAEGRGAGIHFELHDANEGAYFIPCIVSLSKKDIVFTSNMEGLLMRIWGDFEGKGEVHVQRVEEIVISPIPKTEFQVLKPQIIIASVPYLKNHNFQTQPLGGEQYLVIGKLRLYLTALLIVMIIFLLMRLGQ
jgi:hypothetical protein